MCYAWLAFRWGEHGVFDQFNIVFDADPNARLRQLAHGGVPYETAGNFAHPLLPYLTAGPIRVFSIVAGEVFSISDPAQLRISMGMWIAPTCSAMKVAIAYLCGRAMGASQLASIGLALLAGFSLTPAVFGALPEYHSLSALTLTALFAWAAAVQFEAVSDHYFIWLFLAIVVTGMTVTNVVAVGLVYVACRLSAGRPLGRTVAETAVLGVASVVLTLGLSSVYYYALSKPSPTQVTASFASDYIRASSLEASMGYAPALATSLIGSYPTVIPNAIGVKYGPKNAVDIQFSYDAAPRTAWTWARTLLILALVALGGWFGWRADPRFRGLAVGAWLVLAFNGVFHSFWGGELLAYSMHWHAALVMLLAGWFLRWPAAGGAAILALGLASAVGRGPGN